MYGETRDGHFISVAKFCRAFVHVILLFYISTRKHCEHVLMTYT